MGMYSYVKGFRPQDDIWKKMMAAWKSCKAAEVEPPDEVYTFFNGEPPDPSGLSIDLGEHECCSKYSADMIEGFEIDISKLPKNITVIRFCNHY